MQMCFLQKKKKKKTRLTHASFFSIIFISFYIQIRQQQKQPFCTNKDELLVGYLFFFLSNKNNYNNIMKTNFIYLHVFLLLLLFILLKSHVVFFIVDVATFSFFVFICFFSLWMTTTIMTFYFSWCFWCFWMTIIIFDDFVCVVFDFFQTFDFMPMIL